MHLVQFLFVLIFVGAIECVFLEIGSYGKIFLNVKTMNVLIQFTGSGYETKKYYLNKELMVS